ncbi:shikimate dehydrogenase, partial [Candidatus Bathyarchaeota archaeon]|nr:shikimate dehydrogenase [Candidatus Bathyarchaeota archaeon]
TIFNRTGSKAKNLATSLTEGLGCKVEGKAFTDLALRHSLTKTDILINATSVGMYPRENETPIQREAIHSGMTVFDIVYNPLLTRLLKEAKAAKAYNIGGIKMLVYQGALAFELWTGRKPPVNEMCEALEKGLKRE